MIRATRSRLFLIPALACAALAQQPPRPATPAPDRTRDMTDAVWVEGRVDLPEGLPSDERIEVLARAAGLALFREFSAPLDAAGNFRVAFARDARYGQLRLSARYAYLAAEFTWRRNDAATGIVLTPRLGGFLRGKLSLPSALDGQSRVACELVLEGIPATPTRRTLRIDREVAPDMTFECGGLPTDYRWSATVLAEPCVPLVVEGLRFDAGRRMDVEWSLQRGATVRGTIVDQDGLPVPHARINVDCRAAPLAPVPVDVRDQHATGKDGAFSVRGLAPGNVLLWAERAGWLRVESEIEDLKDGEVREGVKVTLRRGNVLNVRVLDPAGQPAVGARVHVSQRPEGSAPLVRDLVTLDDGTVACVGLGPARVDVVVTLESVVSATARPGEPPATGRKRKLRGSLSGVDPSVNELVVTLAEGLSVEGRVLDDLGRTILRYTAGARRADDPNPHAPVRVIDVKSRDGVFEIDDLEPGPWDVFAYGRGLVYEPARRIVIPYTGDRLVFVVRRPAVVSGVVLDATRTPASRVLVEIEWERSALLGGTRTTEKASVTSAPDGKFEITEVFPGAVRVVATGPDGRKSKPIELELGSGAVRSGVEVLLLP